MATPILVLSGPSGAGKTTIGQLVAKAFDPSVLVRADDLMLSIVNGWVEPWLPESAHQNEVLGAAVAAEAIQFATGGYMVVVDGTFFPGGVEGMSQICARRGVHLHYAVLRPDLETCRSRVAQRGSGDPDDPEFSHLHFRFADLGGREANVIDALGKPQVVAEAVLSAFASNDLCVSS